MQVPVIVTAARGARERGLFFHALRKADLPALHKFQKKLDKYCQDVELVRPSKPLKHGEPYIPQSSGAALLLIAFPHTIANAM
jgi:hypothetical protein